MTSCSVDDFFEKDACFVVVVETETKHPGLVCDKRAYSVNVKARLFARARLYK